MSALRTHVTRVVLILAIALPVAGQLHAADGRCPTPSQSTKTVLHDLAGNWTMKVLAARITSKGLSRKVQANRIPHAPVSIATKGDGLVMTLDANGIPVNIPLDRAKQKWEFEAEDKEVIDASDISILLDCDPNTLFRPQGHTRVSTSATTADFFVHFYYVAGVLTGVLRVESPRHTMRESVTLSR